jgi:hypothetical protein
MWCRVYHVNCGDDGASIVVANIRDFDLVGYVMVFVVYVN